ncbi:unnamed protein product [Aspergillus oryzae]|nr:unnamed protein product [Aspergillus oryzae]
MQLMLTEVGHGLDSRNLETTATLLPNGDFDIHTPNSNAAKLLPKRAGSKPLDRAITIFTHVRLPRSALLVPLKKSDNMQESFMVMTRRGAVGSLAFTTVLVPLMKRAVFVAGKYKLRRQITTQNSKPVPIISLRTQQLPILHALAQIAVFEPFAQDSIQQFKRSNDIPVIQQIISFTFKAVLCQASQPRFHALSERCGAQGLSEYNQIIGSQLETCMISIAEGDISAMSISLFDESRSILKGLKGGHRHAEFNSLILPRCPALVEAIGHRRAYEAAAKAGVDSDLLALCKIHAVLLDPSWYIQHTDLTREYLFQKEARLLDTLLPRLDTLLDSTGAGLYCTAPILSLASWDAFVDRLETLEAVGMSEDKARL